jgi:protocatechuate 3,4-dioxygenase beta subunit
MQTIRTRLADGPARTMTELHRVGGAVRDADGEPVSDAWVAIPEAGLWASTDAAGRYRFDRIRPGKHRAIARTPRGEETEATIEVPGSPSDLVIGSGGRAGAKGRAERKK